MLTATQGCGFSDMIASLESQLRSMKMAHQEMTHDSKGCYNLIRAKDRELDAAAVHLEQARAVMVENKASPVNGSMHRVLHPEFAPFRRAACVFNVCGVDVPVLRSERAPKY